MEIFSAIWGGLVSLVTEPIKGWQQRKTLAVEQEFELAKKEQEIKLTALNTQLEMARQGQQINASLDQISVTNMEKSWKDEFVLLVFITPMIMAFVPELSSYSLRGFEIVAKMPEWYIAIIIGMVVVIYGMRGMLDHWLNFKNGINPLNKAEK